MTLPSRYIPTGTVLSGGRGDVQLCIDTFLDRKVAVKSVRHGSSELRNELATLRAVSSNHVVDIYDFVVTASASYLVEEFLAGPHIKVSPSTDEALRILYQVAVGVSDIHAHGVVHGDLKPSNMRVGVAGLVKIFDFGFARPSGHSTVGGRGTIPFMAPELFTHGALKIEPAADTYAFGVLAWFLLEGTLPACAATGFRSPPARHAASWSNPNVTAEIIESVDFCLSYADTGRPSMSKVRTIFKRELNRRRHRGHLFYDGTPYKLDQSNRGVRVRKGSHKATIRYVDGLRFVCTPTSGTVKVNGQAIAAAYELPGCCLISLGGGPDALHVPFDLYEPEALT